MRNKHLLAILAAGTVALVACGDSSSTTPPPATPADTTSTTVTATTAAPPVTPPPQPEPAAPTAEEIAQDQAATEGIRDHHRHHHGGIAQYILLSLDTLGLSPEQKAKVETIKADLHARTAPARDANKALLGVIADGVAAGKINHGKVDAALKNLATASAAAHDASADAFNQLHSVLTPVEREVLVDKIQAHWAIWRSVNVEEQVGSHEKGSHIEHFAHEESLTPEQTDKLAVALHTTGKPDARGHVDPAEVEQYLKTFTAAFASETFDAKALGGGPISGHVATAGGWRLAHFFEKATPILTPEQRTNVAQHLRDRIEVQHT